MPRTSDSLRRTDTSQSQATLFDTAPPLPDGFKYQPGIISAAEEQDLVRQIAPLPFREFEFHRYHGKRRVVSFGWRYDFSTEKVEPGDEIPPFLLPLRERAAAFAGLPPANLEHVLLTEYAPGAAIGWHRDKAAFAEVIGVSLLSACRFRLRRQPVGKSPLAGAGKGQLAGMQPGAPAVGSRRKRAGTWERASIILEPRSAYLLAGPARSEWEHSIPPVDRLRYSITFRNLRR